jgi:acetyl-CoA synthetase
VTGDVGLVDDVGFFFVTGRADDVINCGGQSIGPFELESLLREHTAVREAVVVGKPHPDLGEIPKAFVVPESGFEPTAELATEILRFVNDGVHQQKSLRELAFISSLPRTADGKLRRADLRQQEAVRWRGGL